MMAEELTGGDVARLSEIFSELTMDPVAAASLGQVYRCRLRARGGMEVAVKVQRPDVREGIMLDLHLLRMVAPVAQKVNNLNSDLEGLVDEWGSRFVNELDYIEEADNGKRFSAAMEARGITAVGCPLLSPSPLLSLGDGMPVSLLQVTAAEVIDEATTKRVLTTR